MIHSLNLPNIGKINISDDMEIECLRSTVIYWKDTDDGAVIRTKFRGSLESYLNKTAMFIYTSVRDKKKTDVGSIIKGLIDNYGLEYSVAIYEDCISCLYELWKLILVRWVKDNPFQKKNSVSGGFIVNATHDNLNALISFKKSTEVYEDPSMDLKFTRESLIRLLLTNSSAIYIYNKNSEIHSVVILTKTEYSNILLMMGSVDNVRTLIDYIDGSDVYRCLIAQTRSGDTCSTQLVSRRGFKKCGMLEKELESGDAIVYVH